MSKAKQGEKNEKGSGGGPIARGGNPERYGAGTDAAAEDQQGEGGNDQASRDGVVDPGVGSAAPAADSSNGVESATGETGGADPGTAAPEAASAGSGQEIVRDPLIDRDPGDEAFMREHGAGSDRSIDRSEDFNQERDVAIEGIQDGPGGRKYLILNLTDDTEAQKAAGAYAEAISKDPSKKELAAQLFRLAGVNVGRR